MSARKSARKRLTPPRPVLRLVKVGKAAQNGIWLTDRRRGDVLLDFDDNTRRVVVNIRFGVYVITCDVETGKRSIFIATSEYTSDDKQVHTLVMRVAK